MKLGISTWGMPTVPIDNAIRHIAQLGFDGVELTVIPGYTTELSTLDAVERSRIVGLLKEHNLALPAISGHSSLMEMEAEAHAQHMRRLKGAVDLAVDLAQGDHPPAVNTTTAGRPEQWEGLKQLLAQRTGELVEYARMART